MDLTPDEIGRRIRALRGYADLAQHELAEVIGKSRSTVRRWEDGESSPDAGQLKHIEEICGWPNAFGDRPDESPLPAHLLFEQLRELSQQVAVLNATVSNLVLAAAAQEQPEDAEQARRLS